MMLMLDLLHLAANINENTEYELNILVDKISYLEFELIFITIIHFFNSGTMQ
jgi:hypothetical protein